MSNRKTEFTTGFSSNFYVDIPTPFFENVTNENFRYGTLIKFYVYLACDFFFIFMILNYFYEHWNNKNRFRVFSQGLGRFIVGLIWPFGEVRVERMKRF